MSGLPSNPEEKNRFIYDPKNLQKLTKNGIIQEASNSKNNELQEYTVVNGGLHSKSPEGICALQQTIDCMGISNDMQWWTCQP